MVMCLGRGVVFILIRGWIYIIRVPGDAIPAPWASWVAVMTTTSCMGAGADLRFRGDESKNREKLVLCVISVWSEH